MIVKDEAHCIGPGLASARGLIDRWVIVDTGSTDGTQDVVRQALAGIPGELHERPWVDFGHNRDEALTLAKAGARPGEYALSMDADEHLVEAPTELDLCADGYFLPMRLGSHRYERLALVALERDWHWRAPIHEYLDLPGAHLERLAAPVIVAERLGARSRDPDTYRKDAALLEKALAETPDDPRLQFYLGQSWRDAGEPERALAAYRVRVENLHGWEQERWYAAYQVALLLEQTGASAMQVVEALLSAYAMAPTRAETLVELARVERQQTRFASAHLFAREAIALPFPDPSALFIDTDAYACRRYDEYAVSAYQLGRFASGYDAAKRALAARPDDPRLAENVAWFESALAANQ
jgi:hypothetical protein